MKSTLTIFLFLILTAIIKANASSDTPIVYVLSLQDEIGSTTWMHTKNALSQVEELKADYLLVLMNTYGGTVEHADSIRTAILHSPVPTIAFIDNNAASAGALIALACDSVFMRPDATMGAVTVVNGADGTQMPDKYQSYMRAMMRSTAERHGKDSLGRWRRNPLIAEAMVDSRVIVPGLIDSTKVLTFTPEEAITWHYADGKAENIAQVLSELGINDYRIHRYEPTWVDSLMGFFTNPAVQSILIMIIIGGIYFELQTPGMGFPSVAALTAAVLYFLPLYLTGIASSWLIIVFVIGLVLLLIEIFVIPGFGIAGIAGITLMIGSIFMGLLENFSFSPMGFDMSAVWKSILTLGIGVILSLGFIFYISSRYAPKFIRTRGALTHEQRIEDGYIGVDKTISEHIGKIGTTLTDMRPSGKIAIDGETYDAVSTDGFIEAGTKVKIVRHVNAQLYVTVFSDK